MEDKTKTTSGATTAAEMGVCNMAGLLLPLVEAAQASLSLSLRRKF